MALSLQVNVVCRAAHDYLCNTHSVLSVRNSSRIASPGNGDFAVACLQCSLPRCLKVYRTQLQDRPCALDVVHISCTYHNYCQRHWLPVVSRIELKILYTSSAYVPQLLTGIVFVRIGDIIMGWHAIPPADI